MHEGPHSFSSDVPLVPGHVITNEPGYCEFFADCSFDFKVTNMGFVDADGKWGMRVESALLVKKVRVSFIFDSGD